MFRVRNVNAQSVYRVYAVVFQEFATNLRMRFEEFDASPVQRQLEDGSRYINLSLFANL